MIVNTFSGPAREPYAAFDTETHVLVDGQPLPDEEIRRMCSLTDQTGNPVYPESWWRKHATVKAWAYLIYTPSGFCICENFDEWAAEVAALRIHFGWWYNAPFDMSVLDYDMLSRGYRYVEKPREPGEYGELCSDFGARYTVDVMLPPAERNRKRHRLRMYDLRNLFPGGLDALLEDFDVLDEDGNPIRKLSMDYQAADGSTAEQIAYMRNDVRGLWHLVRRCSKELFDNYGFRIDQGVPDVLTASGAAFRVLLREMFPNTTYRRAKQLFRKRHPMSAEEDGEYRLGGLLGGGLNLLNPFIQGKRLTGIEAYRNDANSHYPAYAAGMRLAFGQRRVFDDLKSAMAVFDPKRDIFIVEFTELYGHVKPDMIPAWRNPRTLENGFDLVVSADQTPVMIFLDEFRELTHWYDFTRVRVSRVICYWSYHSAAVERLMQGEYARKAEAKREKNKAREKVIKLFLNGCLGKFSQNPRFIKLVRELCPEGYVRTSPELDDKGEPVVELDEGSLWHVVQGALVTAGGRVGLRRQIRRALTNVRRDLLYGDTDSYHSLCQWSGADPYALGEFKQENREPITEALFLAPKTYYEIEKSGKMELHSKGVRVESIAELHREGVPLHEIYTPGRRIHSLSAINVPGGKALLPLMKTLCRVDNCFSFEEDETHA